MATIMLSQFCRLETFLSFLRMALTLNLGYRKPISRALRRQYDRIEEFNVESKWSA